MTNDDYLWDKTGERDPTVEKLEELLGRHAHRPRPLPETDPAPAPSFWRPRIVPIVFAAAAAIVLLLTLFPRGDGYRVSGVEGVEIVRVGDSLTTGKGELATIEIADIGDVRLDPDSRLSVERIGVKTHHLDLERGSLHATILAPARVFQIDTPAGRAVDLGCEYSLRVTDGGDSYLSVYTGQVSFELDGRSIYVPAGASCVSLMDKGPGVPVFDDARPEFKKLVERVQFEASPKPDLVRKLCALTEEREEALSLFHLLVGAPLEIREIIFDRLASMFPLPAGAIAKDVLDEDPEVLDAWMEVMMPHWQTAAVGVKGDPGGKRSKFDQLKEKTEALQKKQ